MFITSTFFRGIKKTHTPVFNKQTCEFQLFLHLLDCLLFSLLAQISNLMAFGVVFWFDFEHLFKIT